MMADAKKSELFNVFQAEFSKATSEVRAAGVWFSSDWLVVFHKSCAQSEVTILFTGWDFSYCSKIYCYVKYLRKN